MLHFEHFAPVVPCHVTSTMCMVMNAKCFSGIQLETIDIESFNFSINDYVIPVNLDL